VNWLQGQQGANGLFGRDSGYEYVYGHIIATWVMVEAFAATNDDGLRASAQRGIDYLMAARNPYKVWRYYPRNGDNDTSVTGWATMACRAALECGLAVDHQVFLHVHQWFEEVTDPETGRTGYTTRGEHSARKPNKLQKFPSEESEALTALSLCCRLYCGSSAGPDRLMRKQVELILDKLPIWSTAGGRTDPYFWFWASHALQQIGGSTAIAWSRTISRVLADAQRKDGNFKGSWDPIGPWGDDGGRVYATAIAVLSLDLGHRYATK
jgi:hypothetical protein